MPELPDIEGYCAALRELLVGDTVRGVEVRSPFVLRTFDPPIDALLGQQVQRFTRLGKRIVLEASDDLHLVIHLMIAGRLRWYPPGRVPLRKGAQALWRFDHGALALTEAGTKHRAGMHLVRGAAALLAHDPGGLEVLNCTTADFADRLRSRNHTLKRALTDPRLLSGIGNAFSDEILHAARLSPIALTGKLTDQQLTALFEAARDVLATWTTRLRERYLRKFPGPGEVTAFRPEFAVHGKFGQPCPVCAAPVQRIRYADNETNYCPGCQTAGRVLADRSLSRLLKDDWPRTLEELGE